ncbi:hypothetical protein GCM10022242_02020 [Nocardioides panacisoli]|uniref:Uncharacterized protein n=2 Tax=Nocardioides panacisoli TaxID=627624 RepID=A0ABP7HZI3_9ACTN
MLLAMTYDSRTRDRYRLAVTGATAAVAAAAITATGWLAGTAAHHQDQAAAQRKADQKALARAQYAAWKAKYGDPARARHAHTRIVLKDRPTRTRVTTRYVTAASTSLGQGGTVTPQAPAAPAPHPAAPVHAAPPPPPPPAPTHGS